MSAEKRSCWSCFTCFSRNPSGIADHSPEPTLTGVTASTSTISVPPNASDDSQSPSIAAAASSQPIAPSVVPSSVFEEGSSSAPSSTSLPSLTEVTASTSTDSIPPDASDYSQSRSTEAAASSQPIAPSVVPSSFSQSTVTSSASPTFPPPTVFEVGSSSASSSTTPPEKWDLGRRIQEAAEAVDKENVDADFKQLTDHISALLDFFKEKQKGNNPSKPKAAKGSWVASTTFFKLKEVVSEGINAAKDVVPAGSQRFLTGFLQGMGMAHMITTGFLVVGNILERCEQISNNKEGCLSVLEEMNNLAHRVKRVQEESGLKEGMEASIREATTLIVKASIACCTQLVDSAFSKFFAAPVNGEKLADFQQTLSKTYSHMQFEMGICQYHETLETKMGIDEMKMGIERMNMDIKQINIRLREEGRTEYPHYPKDAVGIEDQVKDVIDGLEWRSDEKAVAVILHGFGGMGKTTLADAVFAWLYHQNKEGYKFSFVPLFEDIFSNPDVAKLQYWILRDLKKKEEKPREIRRYKEGQTQIEDMLKEEAVFLYIDNALLPDDVKQGGDALERLLPENMRDAKRLRLLITARNKDVGNKIACRGIKPKYYDIQSLPKTKAVELFRTKLYEKKEQLNLTQMSQIVKICGGIPKLLEVVAGIIYENPQKAYKAVMEEATEHKWNGKIGEGIELYVFAFKRLEENLREAFLDVCSFFQGWAWDELSNIVKDEYLEMLEKRAFVTRDVKRMTVRVHDVILAIGLHNKGERHTFSSANEIEEFLNQRNDEDLENIKGIWSTDSRDPFLIPASKLEVMCKSLRVLALGPSTDVDGKCERIFEKLIFFSANVSRLPFNLLKGFKELRHLCYKPEDLQNLSQMPTQLRHIDLKLNSSAFTISPICIQRLKHLRVLRLENALELRTLPQELGNVVNDLQELNISNCKYLKELPGSISMLGSLRVLKMDSCINLTKLPEDFEPLKSLQELHLCDCTSLEALPISLGKLTSMQKLELRGCERLEALPSSIEGLSSLRALDLTGCKGIKGLPSGLGKLTSLVNLSLKKCTELSNIPETTGELKLLESINLSDTDLKELPDEFCNLSFITKLEMERCRRLEKLPDRFGQLTSLRKVNLEGCGCLKKLPESFSQLKYLQYLNLDDCVSLEELCRDFQGLSSLRILEMRGCSILEKLPEDFHCLTSLEHLLLSNCDVLEGESMDSIVKIKTLRILAIDGGPLLEARWREIEAEHKQSWSCGVYTSQNVDWGDELLKQFRAKMDFNVSMGGEAFNISDLLVNTVQLLMIIDAQQKFDYDPLLSIIEKSIDDNEINVEMIYFGNSFKELPKKLVDTIRGHAPLELFVKGFSYPASADELVGFRLVGAKIVTDEKGHKYISMSKFLSDDVSLKEFLMQGE